MADMGGGLARALAVSQGRRDLPPRPLGEGVNAFPYSASTAARDRDSDAALSLSVKLDRPANGSDTYLSGEAVHGSVTLTSRAGEEHVLVQTLQVKAYFESRTLFWTLQRNRQTKTAKFHTSSCQQWSAGIGHEWHRGIADSALLEHGLLEEPISVDLDAPPSSCGASVRCKTWHFALHLPAATQVHECNQFTDPFTLASAPRDLGHITRALPPTLRTNPHGSVEWIVEASLRLAPPPSDVPSPPRPSSGEADRPPDFGDTQTSTTAFDGRGFAVPAPPTLLISRAVFPLLPSDHDAAPLEHLPTFSPAFQRRTDSGGAEVVDVVLARSPSGSQGEHSAGSSEDGRDEDGSAQSYPEPQRPASLGGTTRSVWQKRVPLGSKLGPTGVLVSQVMVPECLIIPRTAERLRLQLRFIYTPPDSTWSKLVRRGAGRGPGSPAEDARAFGIEWLTVRVSARTLTRGGKQVRPHTLLAEVRRWEVERPKLVPASVSPGPPGGAGSGGGGDAPGGGTVAWETAVDVDLQGAAPATTKREGKKKVQSQEGVRPRPLGLMTPSFRTPNIEHEYFVTVTVTPKGGQPFCAARFPVQLLAGAFTMPPPPFEAAARS